MRTGRESVSWAKIVWLSAILVLLACTPSVVAPTPSLPDETATALPEVTSTSLKRDTPSPTPTAPPPSPSPEPTPTATAPPIPCASPQDLRAAFVTDLEVPDGTRLPPNAQFRKTWRVHNIGSCSWPEGTMLTFVAGDALPGPGRALVPTAFPDQMVDISVDLGTPDRPGAYVSYWRLQTPSEHHFGAVLFGAVLFVDVIVDTSAEMPDTLVMPTPPAAPELTPEPTLTATLLPTLTKTPMAPATEDPRPTASPMPESDSLVCREPDARFAPVLAQAFSAGLDLQCATGPISESSGELQVFWWNAEHPDPNRRFRSLMLARGDSRTIYVLNGKDATTYSADIKIHRDAWDPSMPERPTACAGLTPPQGHLVPTRGFGEVWCTQSLWISIGWPQEPAIAVRLMVQETQDGLLLEARKATGRTDDFYLVAIDFSPRLATVYQAP